MTAHPQVEPKPSAPTTEKKNVYQLISEVTSEISKIGISKDQTNQRQGYKFRGIDDVYNALSSIISRTGLVILQKCTDHKMEELVSKDNKALFRAIVMMEYTFFSIHDGSSHTTTMPGEANDQYDKATPKATSAAYKNNAFQVFCIPTEGDNDADASSHEVMPSHQANMQQQQMPPRQQQQNRQQTQQQQRPQRQRPQTQQQQKPKSQQQPGLASSEEKKRLWHRLQAANVEFGEACRVAGISAEIPNGLTKAQFEALWRLYGRATEGERPEPGNQPNRNPALTQERNQVMQAMGMREPGEEG